MYKRADCVLLVKVKKTVVTISPARFEVNSSRDSIFITKEQIYKGGYTKDYLLENPFFITDNIDDRLPKLDTDKRYFVFLKNGKIIDRYIGYVAYDIILEGYLIKIKTGWIKLK